MDLAVQVFSDDQTVRSDTVKDLKEINSQSLSTPAKEGEQLNSMMPAIKRAVDLMGADIEELSTKNETLKNQIGDYDEKRLAETKKKQLKQMDNDKSAILFMSRMPKQRKKH